MSILYWIHLIKPTAFRYFTYIHLLHTLKSILLSSLTIQSFNLVSQLYFITHCSCAITDRCYTNMPHYISIVVYVLSTLTTTSFHYTTHPRNLLKPNHQLELFALPICQKLIIIQYLTIEIALPTKSSFKGTISHYLYLVIKY